MDWNRALGRLENDVIKIDVMASDETEFLATHVPFANLAVQRGGRTDAPLESWGEEQVYRGLVVNADNQHRLVMVLGANGAGKSHLIRWLHARFVSSGKAEKQGDRVLFVRRLGNTFRGAISQLLGEGIIKNTDLEARLRLFVESADSQDEGLFMSTIHSNFIDQVRNDSENDPYTAPQRRDIAAFLSDSRIREQLMSGLGPIARFYAQIARATGKVVSGEAGFTSEDFLFERPLIRAVQTDGSKEAVRYIASLRDEDEREQLSQYLNTFVSVVLNRCANIVQGDTREVFAELRRELKKDGKNLTILIEDFTSFRNVDSELITVLATEHGGANTDLCRVTAFVGITDGYYAQFRDNFLDRVTHIITVNEAAYGEPSFLKEFVSRYLNAIYGSQDLFQTWHRHGAEPIHLPVSDFTPPIPWQSVSVVGKQMTLYPFSEKSLLLLYMSLSHKTPREMLRAIRDQMRAFIDDQIDGVPLRFPAQLSGATLDWRIPEHGTHLDRAGLDDRTRARARTLFCLWGSGDMYETTDNGATCIGGLPECFIRLVGITVSGIPQSEGKASPKTPTPTTPNPQRAVQVLSPEQRAHTRRIKSLDTWYQQKHLLEGSHDFRLMMRQFLSSAINWQAEGVSAYIFRKKMDSIIYIRGQNQEGSPERAMVIIERTPQHLDILRGLLEYDFRKGWGGWEFSSANYYQLILAGWVESVKPTLVKSMLTSNGQEWPIAQWAMGVEFYRLALSGRHNGNETPLQLLELLLSDDYVTLGDLKRAPGRWLELAQLLARKQPDLTDNKALLQELKRTYMGVPGTGSGGNVRLFHTGELLNVLRLLEYTNWSLNDTLSNTVSNPVNSNRAMTVSFELAKDIATRIDALIADEHTQAKKVLADLRLELGGELDKAAFKRAGHAMADFLTLLHTNQESYQGVKLTDVAHLVEECAELAQLCSELETLFNETSRRKVLAFYSPDPCKLLKTVLTTIQIVAKLAVEKHNRAQERIAALEPQKHSRIEAKLLQKSIYNLEERIESMGWGRKS